MTPPCSADLSFFQAVGLSVGFCVLYVGCLYLLPARLKTLERDNPKQIMGRTLAVMLASLACLGGVATVSSGSGLSCSVAALVGFRLGGFGLMIGRPILLIALLYLGPLLSAVLLARALMTHSILWRGYQGYVAVPLATTSKGNVRRSFFMALCAVFNDRVENDTAFTLLRCPAL